MTASPLPIDPGRLVDPAAYAAGYPHDEWTTLRRHAPVERFEPKGWPAFWAITRHADIVEVSKHPDTFLSGHGVNFEPLSHGARADSPVPVRIIIEMDNPDHRKFRAVASPFFTPRALRAWDTVIRDVARGLVDGLGKEGECDFVKQVASVHPLRILCHILGASQADEPFILEKTNQILGHDDPEFRRADAADPREAVVAAAMEFHGFFSEILADRRRAPRDDLISVFANARVDGEPMSEVDTMGYLLIMFVAGHETTRGALAGGMKALLDHPRQLAKWRADPHLGKTAVEEILRYVTPVNTMARTVARDVEIGGRQLSAGERLVLFYASANRDETVFEAPDEFRVERSPNPHLAFGIGEHVCLGAHLARRTTAALFAELLPRLELAEASGPATCVASNLVPGVKHLPLHYRIRARPV
jgi:cytochrome P450